MYSIYEAIEKHTYSMASVVALAIRNCDTPADTRLVNFILRNFTTKELMGVLAIVVKQMDLTSFMSSIISVKGLNVLANQDHAPVTSVNGTGVSL